MPPKIKDIATYISILLSAVMIVTFIATRRDISESKLKSKAEQSYVDDQDNRLSKQITSGDNAVRNESEIWQGQHDTRHDDLMIAVGEIQSNVREIKNRK